MAIKAHSKNIPRMKNVGVLGGMGPQATLDFLQEMHKYAQEKIPQSFHLGYPPTEVIFFPYSSILLNKNGTLPKKFYPDPRLISTVYNLSRNVDFIVMPCNMAHIFLNELRKIAKCPIISIIDTTVAEIIRRKLKSVGILGVGVTITKMLYQEPLSKLGIKSTILTNEQTRKLEDSLFGLMEGKNPELINNPAEIALRKLRQQKVEAIILGCTELPILLKSELNKQDIINPTSLLAQETINYSLS